MFRALKETLKEQWGLLLGGFVGLAIVIGTLAGIDYWTQYNQRTERLENMDEYTVRILVPGSHGSGVLIKAPNGETYVLTAGHVAQTVAPVSFDKPHTGAPNIYTYDGENHTGYVAWISSTDDLALIRIYDKLEGTTINCDRAEVGEYLTIIGAPAPGGFFMDWMHTYATVGGYYYNPINENSSYMFFDGSVYGGNSGGPLFNSDGEVVGLVIGMFADFGGFGNLIPMGFNVGIPSNIICAHLGWK